MKSNGFTLIELIVVIAIIAVLSGVIVFSVSQYISKGKDSNVAGNLSVLVPAGEAYYNGNNNKYTGFCDPTGSSDNNVFKNILSQMPDQTSDAPCYISGDYTVTQNSKGVCCSVEPDNGQAWVACAREFSDDTKYFCVDSRGVKKEITQPCSSVVVNFKCPDN